MSEASSPGGEKPEDKLQDIKQEKLSDEAAPSSSSDGETHESKDDMEVDDETKKESKSKESSPQGSSEEAAAADEEEEEAKDADENDEEQSNSGEANTGEQQVDPIFDQMLLKPLFERREKSLKELLESMDEFSPIIPDAVTDYYLNKSGFKTTDHRIKRLLALATQKFVADIASDAYQFSRIRAQSANAGGGAGRGRAGPGSTSGRTVLTMESLNGVLGDYGINAKRPDFYR